MAISYSTGYRGRGSAGPLRTDEAAAEWRWVAVLFCYQCCIAIGLAQNYSNYLEWVAQQGEASVAEFRSQIRPILSAREREIEGADVNYRVLPVGGVNAQASMTHRGNRETSGVTSKPAIEGHFKTGQSVNPDAPVDPR